MNDKQLTIDRWMTKSARDLRTAKTMIQVDDIPTDIVCFHCQQCAEKSLKAFLVFVDYDFPKTHDLPKLLQLCITHDKEFNFLREDADFLADYAVEIRYVDDWRDIPIDEANEALKRSEKFFNFVKRKLSEIKSRQ